MAEDIVQGGETAYYRAIIQQYDKAAATWEKRVKRIIDRYTDKRSPGQTNQSRYNILWSNVENLKPAIYAQTPKPEVERRYLDKDPVGRVASEALERVISYYLHVTPFGSTMRQARLDYLLAGRGVAWVRYVPHMRAIEAETSDDSSVSEDEDAQAPLEEIAGEDVVADYVHWQDFGYNTGRTWEEVFCVWRKVYMTREQMKARRFKDWNSVPLDHVDKDLKDAPTEDGKKATVYELWDKSKRKAFWFAKEWNAYLDQRDDPLGLDKFFPCSEPMFATLSNDSLIPVPDYVEYQDQADELDHLTNRITLMTKAIKAAGVHDASQPAIARLLSEGVENKLIPVDSWAAMAEKGGLAGAMELLPMKEIAETLISLYDAREKVLNDLYQITGLSDLIRGDTAPEETATAQRIKNNFITLRLSEKQREMQRLAANTIEIMGVIIARHFQDDTIKRISGLQLFNDPQEKVMAQQAGASGQQLPDWAQEAFGQPTWTEVLQLLRDNPDRSFRIDIETDSTIEADQMAEQQGATEFVQAIGGFLQQAEGAAGNPAIAVFLGEMLSWACRRWPISRDLQGAIDEMVEKLAKQAQQPQQPPPDPQMVKVQQEGQLAQQKQQIDAQQSQAELQQKAHAAIQDGQVKLQIEREKMAMEDQRQRDQFERQMQLEQFKAQLQYRTAIEVAEIGAKAAITGQQIQAANDATREDAA